MDNKTFPERVKGVKGNLFDKIPESKFKNWLWWQYMKGTWPALIQELLDIHLDGFWRDKGLFCAQIGEMRFYGGHTTEYDRRAYRFLREDIKKKIPLRYFGVVTDIITRYKYPQAVPIAPLYPQRHRLGFSWHHTETISDMSITPEEKLLLTERFRIKPNDIILDVGAYIGFGSMGMARHLEGEGRLIAFECNPEILKVMSRNLENNRKSHILLVPKAAWRDSNGTTFGFHNEAQARSLTEGEVAQKVPTTTIDSMVESLKLPKVDFVSLSINGAELEALEGMQMTLKEFHPNLSIPGWVYRKGHPLWQDVIPKLERYGYTTWVGKRGRIIAWV
ncbi:hypothetical protein LCGC14_0738730 [marine sediment metagenome]|uniref:Methyltransferase FkbM domain-containing protein n=1 Tax=marine sediment metagenome TaxID=412755 RepID=A0A0F9TEL6_9ZZZZ